MSGTPPAAPILALCGSACTGPWSFTAALGLDGGIQVERPEPGARTDLAVLVQSLLRRAGVSAAGIAEVRVDIGPGSYVGLRVAVTFARMLAHHAGLPLRTAGSLELMAAAAWDHGVADGMLRPVLDARRGRLHTAAFERQGGRLRVREAAAAIAPADLAQRISAGERILAAEPLHARLRAVAARAGASLSVPVPVDAGTLFSPSLALETADPAAVEPLYLMGSYAEDGGA